MDVDKVSLMPTSIDEQETVINLDYLNKKAYVYTSRVSVARSLAGLCSEHHDETSIIRCDKSGFEVELPISWISIRPKIKHQLSEEQRQAMAVRVAAAREKINVRKKETA